MSELYSYPSNDYRSYLAHHGVKGMKWGVRHDPERARKDRIMKKYGITSKQYDSVRNQTKERRLKKYGSNYQEYKKKSRARAVGYGLAATALEAGSYAAMGFGKKDVAKIAGAGLAGTVAGTAISELINTPKYYESVINGRSIMDSITENEEFKRMSRNS